MMRILLMLGGVGLVVATGSPTSGVQPAAPSGSSSNPPFNSGQLIYHEAQRRLVMVGGNQPPSLPDLLQLRTWKLPVWTLIHTPPSPSMRTLEAVVYDSRRDRVVVYGGLGTKGLADPRGDTWEWDGRRWFEMPDTAVGPRDHHAMAYDEARGRSVMFGGLTTTVSPVGGARESPSDTWEWDGKRWTRHAVPGPGARGGVGMAYDYARKQIVLFAGLGAGSSSTPRHRDTWSWDGKTWLKVSDEGPVGRNGHAMVFDRLAGVVLMWGGTTGAEHLDDFWQWDGRTWKEISVTGQRPSKRTGASMVYDVHRQRVVLYGGRVRENGRVRDSDEMWEWDGQRWKLVANAHSEPPF